MPHRVLAARTRPDFLVIRGSHPPTRGFTVGVRCLMNPPSRWRPRLRHYGLLLALLGIAPAIPEAPAQQVEASEPVGIPPAKRKYLGREIAQTMHYEGAPWLMRESRQREEDCETLLKALGIQPGQIVCDMGCGNGFYTLPLARLVGPEGKVFAVDIQPEMLRMLQARAAEAGLENIVPLLGSQIDPGLEPSSVDLVLMVDVYHEFSHPREMLQAIHASLKPAGRVALAEFRLEDQSVPIKRLHKMSKRQILREYEANQFRVVEEFDELPWQHLMFFGANTVSEALEKTDR